MHHAALNGHTECVKLILADGAKWNAVDYKGSSALHLAAWSGNSEVVEILLNCNQSTGALSSPASSASPTTGATTAPAKSQHQQVDIDLCNNDNQTPLSLAAQFGHNKVVEMLLSRSANVHIRNSRLESALDLACLNGKLDTVRLLLDSSPSLVADLKRPYATFAVHSSSTPQMSNSDNNQSTGDTGAAPHHQRRGSAGWASALLRSGVGKTGSPSQSVQSELILKSTESQLGCSSSLINASPMRRATLATASDPPSESPSSLSSNRHMGRPGKTMVDQQATLPTSGSFDDGGFIGHNFRMARVDNYQLVGPSAGAGNRQVQQHQLQQASLRRHQFSRQQILLDHSPLHYAVRRGHLTVVNLLLNTYKANIMQLTTLGSVLHEISLSTSKLNSINDMVNLLFAHIGMADDVPNLVESHGQENAVPSSTRLKFLNEFLGLKNSQQQTALDVLDQINNRSAHEIKRLIYEYGDRIRQQETPKQVGDQMYDSRNMGSFGANVRPSGAQQQSYSTDNEAQSSQQQQHNTKQFSEQKHLNSFVTMQRVPKTAPNQQQHQIGQQAHNRPKNQILEDVTNTAVVSNTSASNLTANNINLIAQQQSHLHYPLQTQTMGRSRVPQYKQPIGQQSFAGIGRQQSVTTNPYNQGFQG